LAAAVPALAQEVVPSPPLEADVMALPRLAGESPAVRRINDELQRLDDFDLEALACYYGSRSVDPIRSVEVLADGPEFLSLLIANSTYCEGAAHPWWEQKIVTLDLESGETTQLLEYLPHRWGIADNPEDLLSIFFINSVDDLPMECVRSYARAIRDGALYFDLGLVEAQGALMLWPSGLAYAETPCLEAAYVPIDRLREAGFGERLIEALTPPN
jgi:hypothetical protein